MVGSEGTLGVLTEVTVRLYPLPEAVSAAICSFPSIEAAVRTTIQTIQLGVPIARCELIDAHSVRMVNAHSKLGLREEPMLLMEFHGSPASVKEQAETVQDIASEFGGNAFEWASTPEERTRLWAARHNAYFAAVQSRPGCRAISAPTPACPFPAWPTACSNRCRRPRPAAFPTFSSAMWATATSTSAT
jgi:D-lactate dehydrogenase (cytochrome)